MKRVRKITKKASGGPSVKRFKRVILHVGPDKTGSTSIQSFCDAHRDQLLQHGIYYPKGGHATLGSCFCDTPELYSHNVNLDMKDRNEIKHQDLAFLMDLESELSEVSGRDLIFSYEGFVYLESNELSRLKDFAVKYADSCVIVYYARPPYSCAISAMSQLARTGRLSYVDGCPYIQPHKDLIEKISNVFGSKNVNVRKFSRESLKGGDVVLDFLSFLRVSESFTDSLARKPVEANKSLSREAILVADELIKRTGGHFSMKDFQTIFGKHLEQISGSKICLTRRQEEEIELLTRSHSGYLIKNFGINFNDEREGVCGEIFPPATDLSGSVNIVADLLLKGIDFALVTDFARPMYPAFISEVLGVSGCESFGRWSDAGLHPFVVVKLTMCLPKKFSLQMEVGAFGPNAGKEIRVRVGTSEQSFIVPEPGKVQRVELEFNNAKGANTIEIIPPNPTSPCTLDPASKDTRKLGVQLVTMKIIEKQA